MPDTFSLADTWLLNNRVTLMLLDALSDEQLAFTNNPRARNIADQLAHLHNVRRMWLEVSAPAAAKGLQKLEKGSATKAALKVAVDTSARAMADCFVESDKSGKMIGY